MNERLASHNRNFVRHARLAAWLFALSLFGYPIVSSFAAFLQFDNRLLSITFRLCIAMLSLWTLLQSGRGFFDLWRSLLLLIWCALILRLIYDAESVGIEGTEYRLQLFVVGSLLPCLALWKLGVYDQRRFALAGFVTASIGCLMVLIGSHLGGFGESDLTEITGRLSITTLNPVTLGHLAVSGIFCGLVYRRYTTSFYEDFVILGLMAVMVLVLALGGSKGPILACVILIFWAVRRGVFNRLIFLALIAIPAFLIFPDNPVSTRISGATEDPSTLERIALIKDSLAQIADAPWLGSASVELNSGYYPHNTFLEAAMSLGLPLAALLLVVGLKASFVGWRVLKSDYDLLGLLCFQGLLSSLLSGSMYADTLTWMTLTIILGLSSKWLVARV